jgi:hypothetical protein
MSPAVFLAAEQTAPLHQPEMFGRHVAGNLASLGQFANGVPTLEQHLYDPKSVWMGEGFQALRCLSKRFQVSQLGFVVRLHW